MTRSRKVLTLLLGVTLIPACSDTGLTGVRESSEGDSPQVTAASAVDISGEWEWSNLEVLKFPPFVAGLVIPPITPEGSLTHARCESAGTMTLFQMGAAFQGTATKTFNSCETKGGQTFQQPGTEFVIAEGQIKGGSVHFSFEAFPVTPCPHHAVVSEVQGGVAGALSGTGKCFLPGHPQSESPLPLEPTPGSLSKTLSWEAVRP